jgi:inositol-phosphate phosphatase / L-galactose 1-phosphate phosphatase / histidinol-phosphatase
VTVADREAEAAMRALIAERFPDHGIVGEEHGRERADADYVWILDPIDGTKSFISGIPLFGTLIALLHEGSPVLGVIDQPISRERWRGIAGRGATLNGVPVRARECADLAAATLFSTSPDMFDDDEAARYRRLRSRVKLARYGADCYAYGLVATGFIDCVVEASLKPYDYCAPAAVIEAAGGIATDWQGRPLGLHSGSRVVCSGDRRVHDAALGLLGG